MSQPLSDLPDNVAARRFEFSTDTSYKFWAIELAGTTLTVRFGRIGSSGQTREISFPTVTAAKREYTKRIREKTAGGYKERQIGAKKVVRSDDVWESLADHEPILQAILDDPDEITGYAIYADWLIERGDSRGPFTQLQLSLQDPMLPLYQRAKIEKESQRQRALHARQWLGNLAPWLMDKGLRSYPFDFDRGQLSAIVCEVLSLEFGAELRRSPLCRFLRELTIIASEHTDRALEIDGRVYDAGVKHGLDTLEGADFSNLRDFRVGVAENEHFAELGDVGNGSLVNELIRSMPRLDTLYVVANLNWEELFQTDLSNLHTLHVDLPAARIDSLAQSGLVNQLHTLGFFSRIDDAAADAIIRIPGFDQLAEFVAIENPRLTSHGRAALESTGVLISIKTPPGPTP